jgi:hypothetical protein
VKLQLRLLLAGSMALCGCAASADLRSVIDRSVPAAVRRAVSTNALSGERGTAVVLERAKLPEWLVESFSIEPEPPFSTYERQYRGKKEFLLDVQRSELPFDRYSALSTRSMVDACENWTLSIRRNYAEDLKAGRMKLAPAQCYRLLNPDRSLAYDVRVFTAAEGSFVDADPSATASRLEARYKENIGVYGDGIKVVEPENTVAGTVDGLGITQLHVRRYTYRSTFLHAEFGKRRLYDSYVLMLSSRHVLLLVQTYFPSDTQQDRIQSDIDMIVGALRQPSS